MFVKCKICEGKRRIRVDDRMSYVCCICNGEGGFDIPENTKLCPKCNGRGKVPFITDDDEDILLKCKECSGKGFVDKRTEQLWYWY